MRRVAAILFAVVVGHEGPSPADLGVPVTAGAAPGYVPDAACASCHGEIYRSYQEVGMARSFYRPSAGRAIEDFASGFYHPASRQHFRMLRQGDRLVFRRWQLDGEGREVNVFEQEVDWILGSGNHARTYLFRAPGGELYQLPVSWYAQENRWWMAPGYDRPDHEGVVRRVRRECMFCHNGYPDVPAGSDAYDAAQTYPQELPEGTGCQRCHGPGAEHLRRASGGVESQPEIRAAIVNPGKLAPERRDDVCYGCHLQPAVALPGVRRFGRGDYSFRPGEALTDYLVPVDVTEEGKAPGERFEINHHAYRLRQSLCFAKSAGKLSCLTCHDPHRKVQPAERAAHYRAACLTCHQMEDCKLDATSAGTAEGIARDDCSTCHMPKRRPQDVVHTVMTDHRIGRRPAGDLLAPLAEADPELTGVSLYFPDRSPPGAEGELFRALSVARTGASGPGTDRVAALLAKDARHPTAWLELGQSQLQLRRFAEAEATLSRVLAGNPDHPLALDWLAIARASQGRTEDGVALLRRALAQPGPGRTESRFNLARLLAGLGQRQEALALLSQALAERPNFAAAWYHKGNALAQLEDSAAAVECYRRALAVDPAYTPAYLALGRALLARGERSEALRVLRHGKIVAARPGAVAEALAELEKPPEKD